VKDAVIDDPTQTQTQIDDDAAEPPVVHALEEAEELHELADAAAESVVTDAAAEAVAIEELTEAAAEETLREGVDDADQLQRAGEEDAAESVLAEAIVEAVDIETVGELAAEEVLAEAVIEAAVLEEAADEVGEELVAEAVESEAAEVVAEELVAEAAQGDGDVEPAAHDPFGGPGEWYVVHTYAGYENKVKTNLESRIHTMQMEDKIFNVHIPMEDVMEIKGGKKQVVQKKVFPGYLLVKMWYDNDSWYVVRNTPGVTGFVSSGTGSKPTPLSKREIDKILVVKKEEVKPQFRLGFEEGDVVRIISGPFADFNGTINEINVDQSKLKVLVNIFDRETPVELGFDQVSKV
jgi:transcriptional antiterminator NusG